MTDETTTETIPAEQMTGDKLFAAYDAPASVEDEPAPEATPEPVKEPGAEPEPEGDDEQPEEDNKSHVVSKKRFNEVNDSLKRERDRADKAEAERQQLLAAVNEAFKKPADEPAAAAKEDDLDLDALLDEAVDADALKPVLGLVKKLQAKIDELEGKSAKADEDSEIAQANNAVMQTIASQSAEFRKEHPDLPEAIAYMKEVEIEHLADILDDGKTPRDQLLQHAAAALSERVQAEIAAGVSRNKNIAEMFWKRAKTLGYQPKGAAPAAKKDAPKPNLDAIDRNQRQTKSLGDVPGAAATGGPGGNVEETIARLRGEDGKVDVTKLMQITSTFQQRP